MKESAESVISKVLEAGERIVWSGRPSANMEHAPSDRSKRSLQLVVVGASILTTLWLLHSGPGSYALGSFGPLPLDQRFLVPIGMVLLLVFVARVLKLDPASRVNRYLESLTYASTDRRLLILERGKISEAYSPAQLREPRIQERAPSIADVIFDERPDEDMNHQRSRDPVFRERANVGFKSLPNAREVREVIYKWIDDHHRQTADQVADFLTAVSPVARSEMPVGIQKVSHASLGLALSVPEEWTIRVRRKNKPQGKLAWDVAKWQALGDIEDWNVIRIEGPSLCTIEVEVFETAPTVAFDKLVHSKLADSVSGKVIDARDDYEVNGIQGFFVTRRNDLRVDPTTGRAGIAAVVTPERQTVLHDGRRQVCIVSTWPENRPELERGVQAVVESIELS